MKKILFSVLLSFLSIAAFAQPSNDDCSGATSLGTLPTPAACPSGIGAAVNTAGTTITATGANPYTTLLNCQTGGNQPGPALDVWYTFVATGNLIIVNITPGPAPFLANPAVTLWSGTCGGLVGMNCANNGTAAGNLSATFAPTTPGVTYYLEVSGMNSVSSGNFNLSVNNNNDCNNCNLISSLTATPAPVNGTYAANQTVTFCYTISSYNQVSSNWLHGVIPTFGCGWNTATIVPGNPNEISANGLWGWYNSCTSSATGSVTGAGFYFDYSPADGNPGNNFGDYNPTSLPWTFCWTITTKATCACNNLNISINTTGDGESGSWSSIACQGDPNYTFAAVLNCCSVTATNTNITCFGATNGTATATQGSGTGPFTYSWNSVPVQSGTNANNLPAGTYTVTSTDNVGCVSTAVVTVTQPPVITATQSQVNVSCNGACNGTATVVPAGGTGTYIYAWAPAPGGGQGTATATGLCQGSYTCTISSPAGCSIIKTFNITQPTALTATSSSTSATCGAGSGTVTANPSGGSPGYSYSWNSAPIQTTQTATNLPSGSYTCTVTDLNGCTTTTVAVVTSTGGITANISSSTNVSCFGGNNGNATAAPVGGTAPFTYSWTTAPVQTTATATGLSAGSYTCTVTDFNGCSATASITITQPPVLTTTFSQVDDVCNGGTTGTATVNPAGGTPGYTYSWNSAPVQTTQTATGLGAGSYTCTITDLNGCIITQPFTLTQPAPLTASTSFVQSTCGNPNGTATVNILGGTPVYTVSWNTVPIQTTTTATGLLAGSYTVTVTDANGCTTTATVNVSNAGSPTASITATTNVSCFGGNNGSLTVTGAGGTPGYTYSWSSAPVQTTQTASGLTAGSYTVTLTDANGCSTTASAVITEPPVLTISGSSTNVDCFGNSTGTASVIAGGGSPAYSYSWNSIPVQTTPNATALVAGSYTCTVTDANGCIITQSATITEPVLLTVASAGFNVSCFNSCDGQVVAIPNGGTPAYSFSWNTGCTSPSCNNICAGSYTVTITDGNGCIATSSTTVTQPTAISVVTAEVDAHCNQPDGSASAVGAGGTGLLTYQWIGGPANANYNNIAPNTYSVIVTDANGCADTANTTVNNLNGVNATLTSVTNLTCFNSNDGAIVTGANGGIIPYTYSWTAPAVSITGTATSLSAGNYTLTVTDASGCTSTVSATVTQPPVVTITASSNPPAVCNGAGVQISSTGGGGTPGYTYSWSPGALSGNTQNIIPAATTTYTAYVVDTNGCSDSTTVLVTVNPVPVAALSGDVLSGCAPLCVNFTDVSTVAAPGVVNSWVWNFGDGSPVSNLQNPGHCFPNAGPYTITLDIVTTDGCVSNIVMPSYVNVFANPVAAFGAFPQPTTILSPVVTFTDSSINATSWNWSFGDLIGSTSTLQNPSFTFPNPTCYDVVLAVASIDGCVDTAIHQICIDPDASIFVPNAFTPNDDGINDYFMPVGVGMDPDHFEMWIFDRWGNMIYYTDDMAKGWDGRVQGHTEMCQIDTYVWKIKAIDILGNKHNLIGKVSIVK